MCLYTQAKAIALLNVHKFLNTRLSRCFQKCSFEIWVEENNVENTITALTLTDQKRKCVCLSKLQTNICNTHYMAQSETKLRWILNKPQFCSTVETSLDQWIYLNDATQHGCTNWSKLGSEATSNSLELTPNSCCWNCHLNLKCLKKLSLIP